MKRDHTVAILSLGFAVLAFLLFREQKRLRESVQSRIVPEGFFSKANTITPDPATGLPRVSSQIPSTLPERWNERVAPIDPSLAGAITNRPRDPLRAMCPIGHEKFLDVADGSWWCVPVG